MERKYQIGDRVVAITTGYRYIVLDVLDGYIKAKASTEPYHEICLDNRWICMDPDSRVKMMVRLERKDERGRVYVDVTFDACKLQTLIVYSGDLETAEKIYAGELRLTADSELEPAK